MKILTVEDLQDRLYKDISWRKHELSFIKNTIASLHNANTRDINTYVRGAITLLYAHWEGAIKHMTTHYLLFVASLPLSYSDLSLNFYALSLKKEFKRIAATNKNTILNSFLASVFSGYAQPAVIPAEDAISTNSNLTSTVFEEIMASIGLDCSNYATKYNLIDKQLLVYRNHIAHGEIPPIMPENTAQYIELHDKVVSIIFDLNDQIIDSAIHCKYLNNNNSSIS